MKINYVGNQGDFTMENPEMLSYLYFPIANESGVMSSVAPDLAGDSKMSQNSFLMPPAVRICTMTSHPEMYGARSMARHSGH